MAALAETEWREHLHPRGPDGRFIDVLAALKLADEKDVTGALQSILYDFPQEQDVRLDIGGVTVHSRAGSGVFRTTPDQGNEHLGYPSTATSQIVRMAREREAARKEREAKAAEPPKRKSSKRTLKHVMADGRVVTRQTARDYTHVVTAVKDDGTRVDLTWSGSAANAEKRAQELRNRNEGAWKGVRVEKVRPPKSEESVEEAFTAPSGGGQPRYSGAARDARKSVRARGLTPGSHRLGAGGRGAWDEKKHPRGSKGTQKGGQFISKGDSGAGVRAVQRRVGARTDGKYGRLTEAAVRRFQRKHGLVVDGKVGRQTAQALAGNFEKARRTKTGKLTSADRRMIRKSAKRRN